MQSNSLTTISPSFTGNSSHNNLSDIAARVVEEFRQESGNEYDDIFNFNNPDNDNDEDEFEFAASISADQKYPLFDTSLLADIDPNSIKIVNINIPQQIQIDSKLRLPLFKLLSLERDFKSEVDDLAGVTPGTYCVWNPKSNSPEKSNPSRNSSRRWKLRNIFNRSSSFGKVASAENKDHRRRSYLPSGEDLVTAISTVSRSNRTLRPF